MQKPQNRGHDSKGKGKTTNKQFRTTKNYGQTILEAKVVDFGSFGAYGSLNCWRRLKKVVGFLVGTKRVVWRFFWQSVEEAAELKVITDADWSGRQQITEINVWKCGNAREALLETWSTSQGAIALFAADAELYAMVGGASRMKDM